MEKYINAEKFLQAQRKRCTYYPPLIGTCPTDNVTLDSEIIKFPAADVVPVKHGKWIIRKRTKLVLTDKAAVKEGYHLITDRNRYKAAMVLKKHIVVEAPYCSLCSYRGEDDNPTPYCPNCGARMDGDGR